MYFTRQKDENTLASIIRAEAREEGIKEGKLEIARKLLSKNMI